MDGPVMIPSISSFETQIFGPNAMKLHTILQEPISLISAYDLALDKDLHNTVADYRKKGGLIFVDSGGYEASRVNKYIKNIDPNMLDEQVANGGVWSIDKFQKNIGTIEFDLAATFDMYIGDDEEFSTFEGRLLTFIERQEEFLGEKMVPVIHLRSEKGARELTHEQSLSVVNLIAKNFKPKFIAIPEREMGEGVIARYELVKSLVSELQVANSGTNIHVLGCGNPLTFAILAHAGIALADGLEWCRTNYGHEFHLFHFQQFDILRPAERTIPNAVVDTFLSYTDNRLAQALARNLHSQQDFVERVKTALHERNIVEFLTEHFEILPELKELLA